MTMFRSNIVVGYLLLSCWHIALTNSRTSTLWQLNTAEGKITKGNHNQHYDNDNVQQTTNAVTSPMATTTMTLPYDGLSEVYAHDDVFYIIATTTISSNVGWIRQSPERTLEALLASKRLDNNGTQSDNSNKAEDVDNGEAKNMTVPTNTTTHVNTALVSEETLDCGKPVNFTYYDYLIGVGQRFNHPRVPEPEVAYLFLKSKDEEAYKNFDIGALERRLKRAKRDKPRSSVQLYNQIGNYWRIVGDARHSIECFRRALAMSPTNAEVLLNLARVLYNLQYLDDAIHLTRRSLEMQPPGRSAWQQYFTLGEIFKAYGHFQESILHLRHALELYPHHEPILKALRDIENNSTSTLHVYTVVIIIALVVAVFVVIITSSNVGTSTERYSGNSLLGTLMNSSNNNNVNGGSSSSSSLTMTDNATELKTQRHFNRAMAMRSLKGLSSMRNSRTRKH